MATTPPSPITAVPEHTRASPSMRKTDLGKWVPHMHLYNVIKETEEFIIQCTDMKYAYSYYRSLFKGASEFLDGSYFALRDQEKALLKLSASRADYETELVDTPEKDRRGSVSPAMSMMSIIIST